MNHRLFIPALIIILFITPTYVSADFDVGDEGVGIQIYTVEGYMVDIPFVLLIVSELANNSDARGWEVSIVVLVQEDVSYFVQVIDSHHELRGEDPNAIPTNEGKVVGTHTFGPWSVRADGSPEFGDLIWQIYIKDLSGRETYLSVIMRWGEGTLGPPKIEGYEDDTVVGKYSGGQLAVIIFLVIVTLIATLLTTYNKQKNKHITPKALFKDENYVAPKKDES